MKTWIEYLHGDCNLQPLLITALIQQPEDCSYDELGMLEGLSAIIILYITHDSKE